MNIGSIITQLFIYIFSNPKKRYTTTNQQHTGKNKLRQCELAADTPPKGGENYRNK